MMLYSRSVLLPLCLLGAGVSGAWLSAGPGASALASSAGAYYSWCMAACMGGTATGGLLGTVMTAGMAAPAAASGMCYGSAACAAACSSITGGTAIAVGVAAGAATGGACFADGSKVKVREERAEGDALEWQYQSIEDVRPGAFVETLSDDGDPVWTKVMSNNRFASPEEAFVQVDVFVGSGKNYSLMVTEKHLMIAQPQTRAAADAAEPMGQWELIEAKDLQQGALVKVVGMDGKESGAVASLHPTGRDFRNVFVTASGSALVNSVLVTTTCEDAPAVLKFDALEGLHLWRESHSAMWTSLDKALANREPFFA